jgi:hypothetical protein
MAALGYYLLLSAGDHSPNILEMLQRGNLPAALAVVNAR